MPAPRAQLARSRAHRGFTLIEVILALVLSAFVVGGVFGLMALMSASESRHAARFTTTIDRAAAQEVLRLTFRRLFSAEPLPEPAPKTGDEPPGEQGDAATVDTRKTISLDEHLNPDRTDRAEVAKLVKSVLGDTDLADQLLQSMDEEEPPHFFLYVPDASSGLAPGFQRLQVTMTESPVPLIPVMQGGRVVSPLRSGDDLFRGAIQFAPTGAPDGSVAMQWQPEDPPGRPTTLLSGIVEASFTVLPQQANGGDWQTLWAAYLHEDFPVAVHVELVLNTGEHLDWLFETTVLEPAAAIGVGLRPR